LFLLVYNLRVDSLSFRCPS